MDKIFIRDLPTIIKNGKTRLLCEVQCPDCKAIRIMRKDSFATSITTVCRSCNNKRRPTKQPEDLFDITAYVHTKKGKVYQLYQAQKQSSIARGYTKPNYSQEELYNWVMSQDIWHELFAAWETSGYLKNLSPSIDRIDDYISYTLENIRIVTWEENDTKGKHYQIIGKTNKNSKAVDQFTLDGKFIARYFSQQEAMRKTGICSDRISKVCLGQRILKYINSKGIPKYSTPKSAGGFIWKFSSIPNDITEKTNLLP